MSRLRMRSREDLRYFFLVSVLFVRRYVEYISREHRLTNISEEKMLSNRLFPSRHAELSIQTITFSNGIYARKFIVQSSDIILLS